MPECGTYAAYQRHKVRGEVPCEPCRIANRDYTREWRAKDGPGRARERERALAANRAKEDLIQMHRADYHQLYEARLEEIRATRR